MSGPGLDGVTRTASPRLGAVNGHRRGTGGRCAPRVREAVDNVHLGNEGACGPGAV